MSIEYTIDIQLTELGFPDIVSGREARSIPASPKRRVQAPQPEHEAEPQSRKPALFPAGVRDGKEGTSEPSAGGESRGPGGGDGGGSVEEEVEEEAVEEEEEDSDDSEVSDVCDEEEVEVQEDEEGLCIDPSHPMEYRCGVCDLQLPSQFKLQDHMNLHTGARPYYCAECGKRFCQIYNYRVHLRTHANVDRLMCRVCRMGFMSQRDLDKHLSSTHFEKEFYECDLCKYVFTSLRACEKHVQLHTSSPCFKCESCGRSFPSTQALLRHQRRKCRRLFKCTDCSLTFTKKTALLKHSFSHLGLLPYTCLRCHYHFRLAQLYRRHKCEPGRVHCGACLREFLCQGDFEQHKKDTGCWGNQEPKTDEIRCLECGERFDTKEELKKHAGAHQRVLNCAECGKGFRSALLLMSHMGGHAGQSPCLCQSCGLGFPHQQNYESHLKTCGQTDAAGRAPKKRPAGTSFSSLTKVTRSDTPHVTIVATPPAALANHSSGPSAAAANASSSAIIANGPNAAAARVQPSGVNLVLLLPVCSGQTDRFPVPSAAAPALPLTAAQAQTQQYGIAAPFKLPLLAPINLVPKVKQEPQGGAPMDLTLKCSSPAPAAASSGALPPVKSEPVPLDVSGVAGQSQTSHVPVNVSSVKTETCTEESS